MTDWLKIKAAARTGSDYSESRQKKIEDQNRCDVN
jgi:hypothetical protein